LAPRNSGDISSQEKTKRRPGSQLVYFCAQSWAHLLLTPISESYQLCQNDHYQLWRSRWIAKFAAPAETSWTHRSFMEMTQRLITLRRPKLLIRPVNLGAAAGRSFLRTQIEHVVGNLWHINLLAPPTNCRGPNVLIDRTKWISD
jgi:hypothetical protein